jgi:hypothetical protein
MCNAAAGASAPVHARDEVIDMLRHDFGRVLAEFREFQQLDRSEAAHAGQRIVQRTLAELKVIAAVEQKVLYPAVRNALKDTDLIDQSEIEHACIRRLIGELEEAEPSRAGYPKDFRVLGEHVRLHALDEEHELFPALRDSDTDWERVYASVCSCRAEMAEDLGVPQLAEVNDDVALPRFDLPIAAPASVDDELVDETAEA